MYKAQGDMWVDGTALYYIMRTPEYFYPPLTPFFLENDLIIVIGTYAAMIILIGFPFLVLSRTTRPWAVTAMMGFHLSIAVLLGLTSFALVMIACDAVFISSRVQHSLDAIRGLVRHRGRPVTGGQVVLRDPSAAVPAPDASGTTEPVEVP